MIKKLFTFSFVILLSACADDSIGPPLTQSGSGNGSDTNQDGINRTQLLTNIVDNHILKTLGASTQPADGSLVFESQKLQDDTLAYCGAIGRATESNTLSTVQTQWKKAMGLWQQLQMSAVGPLDLSSDENNIYAWPESVSNTCLIHLLAIRNRSNPDYDVSGSTGQVRGFQALEEVFFSQDLNYACNGDSVEKQQWQSLTDVEKKQALCNFAKAASKDLTNSIKAVANEWETGETKANFINDVDASTQKIVDALFNLEKLTKDRKLGAPTGLHSDCIGGKVSCPELVESRLSENSIENIRNNIKGFLAIFTGGDNALGFDDILIARLNKSVSVEMITRLEALDTKLASFTGSLESGVTDISKSDCVNSSTAPESNRVVEACALFGELKAVTDLLKTDFTAIVNVNVPTNAAGDGD